MHTSGNTIRQQIAFCPSAFASWICDDIVAKWKWKWQSATAPEQESRQIHWCEWDIGRQRHLTGRRRSGTRPCGRIQTGSGPSGGWHRPRRRRRGGQRRRRTCPSWRALATASGRSLQCRRVGTVERGGHRRVHLAWLKLIIQISIWLLGISHNCTGGAGQSVGGGEDSCSSALVKQDCWAWALRNFKFCLKSALSI